MAMDTIRTRNLISRIISGKYDLGQKYDLALVSNL